MAKVIGRKVGTQIPISTRELTTTTASMDTVNFFGIQAVGTREITKMMSKKVMEKCIGQMGAFIEDFGMMEFKLGSVS